MTDFQSDLRTYFWIASMSFGFSDGLAAAGFGGATGAAPGAGGGEACLGGAKPAALRTGEDGAVCGTAVLSTTIVDAGASAVFLADCIFWLVPFSRASEYCCSTCRMRGRRLIRSRSWSSV